MTAPEGTRPKVFISYSWSSPAHEERVLELAKRLISDGVEVILDKFDLQQGQDLHQFMERMVTDATVTHVLVVTDRVYVDKADKREKGVGKEALIISAEVYARADQTKFVAVIFESVDGEPCCPAFLKGRVFVDMSTPERAADNYESLIRHLYGKPLHQKPPLGKPPAFLETSAVSLPTAGKAQLARSAVLEQKSYADAVVEEYFSFFCDSLGALRISTAGGDPFDDRIMASVESFLPYRNEFVGMVEFLAGYRNIDHTYEAIGSFFECAADLPPGSKPLRMQPGCDAEQTLTA